MELINAIGIQAGDIVGIKSLLVCVEEELLLEKYYNAHQINTVHDVRSVTKSFLSTLIGLAIEQGYIIDVNEPIGSYLAIYFEELPADIADITISQLLTMSCGLDWSEIPGPSEFSSWIDADDQLQYIIEKPFTDEPGTQFNYSDGAAHLLSAVLTRATGMSTMEFADQYLFSPLDIEPAGWLADNRNINLGGVGLQITSRDMLKLGLLYMNYGKYDGTEIISREWIDSATTRQISTEEIISYGPGYGFYWWVGRLTHYDYYFANGYGGQFIIVVPDLALIVVTTCDWHYSASLAGQHWFDIITLIMEEIIPAVD